MERFGVCGAHRPAVWPTNWVVRAHKLNSCYEGNHTFDTFNGNLVAFLKSNSAKSGPND